MDTIFSNYSFLVRKLTDYVRKNSKVPKEEQDIAWQGATRAQACDAIRPVLPAATKSTVGIYASGQSLESLIYHLMSDSLPECRLTGEQLLIEARKVVPMFLERADKPERGGAFIAYRATTNQAVKKLTDKYLPEFYLEEELEDVTLTDYFPKNELDLIADMLYSSLGFELEQIKKELFKLSYEQKLEIFNTYIGERLNRRHRPGRALEKAHYSFDLLSDYGIFRDLQRHRMVDDLNGSN